MTTYKEAIDFEHLYTSALKCKRNVLWKSSVSNFMLNVSSQVRLLSERLNDGTYKSKPPTIFKVHFPKERDILSVPYMDRVYQRSLNDNILYPIMTKSFILDNCACQKGKGTDFARSRIKEHLHRFYRKHKTEGYVLQIDIKKYYASMNHSLVEEMFRKKLDDDTYKAVEYILRSQYQDEKGYSAGSQLIQIAGISFLNGLDHYIKEKLAIKGYIRYMDDLILIHDSKEYLEQCLVKIEKVLEKLDLKINTKKTNIHKVTDNTPFLGFNFRLNESGKVLMTMKKSYIKRQKKHIKGLVRAFKKGDISKQKLDNCYMCLRDHTRKGNTYYYTQKLDKFYKEEVAKVFKK
jgi:hypothetical protein